MPYKLLKRKLRFSLAWRIGALSICWLVLISCLHQWINTERGTRQIIRMGYMPVISNLACPILDEASKSDTDIRFHSLKFASFAEMAEALRNDHIQVAFMIAPLSVVLRQQGEDVKVIYIGNRHESTLVTRKALKAGRLEDLTGRTLAVPMRYSGHNISIMQLMAEKNLRGQINVVEMNPPDMAAALAAGSLDAYYVGEPFAAQTLKSGHADVMHYVEELWPNFICNLMVVRQEFIDSAPRLVERLVEGAARAGIWAAQNVPEAARIASAYWNQNLDLVEYSLTTPKNRVVYDRFVPRQDEIQQIADLMIQFSLLENNDVSGLVDDRFARQANLEGITNIESILRGSG